MLILGIEPGTATTGYGVLNVLANKTYAVEEFGLIETSKEATSGKRLTQIHREIKTLVKRFRPDIMAIEKIFFATNAKTAIAVGQATGVMIFTASMLGIEIAEYAPGTIKKQVAGDGRADKKMVQKAVRAILGAKIKSRKHKKTHFDNAADALAVALCHAKSINSKSEYRNPKQ